MSASCTIQAAHPSSTWTTYRRPLLHHIPAPACCFGYIFLHRHFLQPLFWICRIQLLPQGYGGSLAHSLLSELLYLEPVPSQPSLTWSHCVSFRLPYSPACDYFSPSSIFSPRTFFWIFHTSLQDEDKGGVFHTNSYLSLSSFAGMYTPRHSVLKGPRQFLCPVLTGLKVPVYKVKFVIRIFLPGGKLSPGSCYHQLRPNHATSQVATFIKLSQLQF